MNNQRVQTLEALLTRIKKNAGEPRPERARVRAEAPVGAETRAAAAPKPAAEVRTVPPAAAKATEPPKAAAAPVAKAQAADVLPSHAGPPKVTPRLIDPVTSADQDPAKWTLDEMGAESPAPAPSPKPAPAAAKPAARPVEPKPEPALSPPGPAGPRVERAIPEARPSPRQGLGLGGFGKQIEAKKEAAKVETPKAAPVRQETPKAPPARPMSTPEVSIDIDEPTTMEDRSGGVPSLSESADEEVEATVSGPIPTHILEMTRTKPEPEKKPEPVPAPILDVAPSEPPPQPEPRSPAAAKGLGHTMPMAMDAPDLDIAPSPNVTLPMEQPKAAAVAEIRREPEPIKAEPPRMPDPEPAPVLVEKRPEPAPEPRPEPAAEPIPEKPAFSSGGSTDGPSKFAQDPVELPRTGSSWFVKSLIFVVVVVAVAAGVFVYTRRDEFFGSKPQDTAPPPSSEPAPTPTPTTPASTTPQSNPPSSAEPATSVAPATSGSTAPAATAPGDPPKDPKQLGPAQGYIFVQTTQEGDVYSGGVRVGATNEWVITPCKAAFIGLGKKANNGVQWVVPGKTVPVPCQDKLVYPIP